VFLKGYFMTLPDITIDRSLIQTEEEMLARWGKFDRPLVSIYCMAYNHEKYIRDALDGFLIQKTDFPFEILVHDDASTDGTVDIIREYEKRYPKIIKPIYQVENQYSQGNNPGIANRNRAQGEYIAMCEGDDYWIDSEKLQIQVNAMESSPEYNISFHPAVAKYEDGSRKNKIICSYSSQQKVFTTKEVIEGGGGFMPTASIIFRKKCLKDVHDFMEKYNPPVGDYIIQIITSHDKGALFVPKLKSVYRMGVEGSWSSKQKNFCFFKDWFVKIEKSYNDLNNYFDYVYKNEFKKILHAHYFAAIKNYNVCPDFKKCIIERTNISIKLKDSLFYFFLYKRPNLHKLLAKVKHIICAA
jgi:glycosyltransferase involved in cell wall biosynthesis